MQIVDNRFLICLARRVTIIIVALAFSFATAFTSAMAMHIPHQDIVAEEAAHSSSSGSDHSLRPPAPSQSDDRTGCNHDQVSARCIGSSCFSSGMPPANIPPATMIATSLHLKAGASNFGAHLKTPPPVRPPNHV